MKVSVLASGSKGNVTYVEVNGIKMLLDCGRNFKYINEKLDEIDVNPSEIDYILITHVHVDHVSALKVFLNKCKPKVILKEGVHHLLPYVEDYIYITEEINIEGVNIKSIDTSHDSKFSTGYIIDNKKSSLAYVTDTGYLNQKVLKLLKNHDLYIFESNHDVEMLMESSRPHHIKLRILGDEGHLSNDDSAYYLESLVGDKTKHIILAHLSMEANSIEKVLECHQYAKEIITISTQIERTELIEID